MKVKSSINFDQKRIGDLLLWVYESLYSHFGPQHWWPADTDFEVIIGAILTQSMSWNNVEKAIANLKSRSLLDPQQLSLLKTRELAKLIRPAGYYNAKACKIKAFLRHLDRWYENDLSRLFEKPLETTRNELLTIYGIGPETADSILLYAGRKPIFVIDTYTKRMFSRMKLMPENIKYEALQSIFMRNLPNEVSLFQEYHALIIQYSKTLARKSDSGQNVYPLCLSRRFGRSTIRL